MNNGQIQLCFRLENQAKISGESRSQPKARIRIEPSVFPTFKPENQGALWRQAFLLTFWATKSKKKSGAKTN